MYDEIPKQGGYGWKIASAARVGQLFQSLSDQLFTAPIPKDVQAYEEAVDEFCGQLTIEADKSEAKAVDNFKVCLQASRELNWFSSWSKLCEHELGTIRPGEFPSTDEIRGEPDEVPMAIASQGIVAELERALR